MESTIILAGATGNLGHRIAGNLLDDGAALRVLARRDSDPTRLKELRDRGASVALVDYDVAASLTAACEGGSCVVSALSGLEHVIVEAQTRLLDAALAAGAPRFIPSDYAVDFTKLPAGNNRNFDLRRRFRARLEQRPIAATSILSGMFTDLLVGPAPVVLFRLRKVLYWEDADQLLDFTTVDDTARYTASAAQDPSTPRFLRIAGEQISARGLALAASEAVGGEFKLVRAGGLGRLRAIIRVARALAPARDSIYPPWQGMQYLHDMFSGLGKLDPLDNDRYSMEWTGVREVLATGCTDVLQAI